MIVIVPIPTTPANLTSSTVPDVDASQGEVVFAAGDFVVGDTRVDTTVGKKYACIVAGALTLLPSADPIHWEPAGASNRFAMFDLYRNTQTISSSTIVAVVALSKRIDTIVFAGMEATSVRVEMLVGGDVVFDSLVNLQIRNTRSWTGYFHGAFESKQSAIIRGVPIYANASLRITVINVTGDAKCGAVVFNASTYIGDIELGAESDALNYSKIIRSEIDGSVILYPRPSYSATSQSLNSKSSNVDKIREVRRRLNAVPAAWVGLEKTPNNDYFDTFLIVGIYRKFKIGAPKNFDAKIQLELEEI